MAAASAASIGLFRCRSENSKKALRQICRNALVRLSFCTDHSAHDAPHRMQRMNAERLSGAELRQWVRGGTLAEAEEAVGKVDREGGRVVE